MSRTSWSCSAFSASSRTWTSSGKTPGYSTARRPIPASSSATRGCRLRGVECVALLGVDEGGQPLGVGGEGVEGVEVGHRADAGVRAGVGGPGHGPGLEDHRLADRPLWDGVRVPGRGLGVADPLVLAGRDREAVAHPVLAGPEARDEEWIEAVEELPVERRPDLVLAERAGRRDDLVADRRILAVVEQDLRGALRERLGEGSRRDPLKEPALHDRVDEVPLVEPGEVAEQALAIALDGQVARRHRSDEVLATRLEVSHVVLLELLDVREGVVGGLV
jgi:hypothetical protein